MVSSKGRARAEVGLQLPSGMPMANLSLPDRLEVVDRPAVKRLLRDEPALASVVSEAADQLANFVPDTGVRTAVAAKA